MHAPQIETERLLLRPFTEADMEALLGILQDEEANTFLPWVPLKSIEEAAAFYRERILPCPYYYAICFKEDHVPVGYIKTDGADSYDFGYALRKEFWHQGIMTEAGRAFLKQLKQDGIPYITATHDVHNPRSGGVMRQLGMQYQYSYEEQWQPKDFLVTFRMYQLNLDGEEERVYRKYWNLYDKHFVEEGL